jgi:signal transduction histidine kinase
MLIMLLRVVTLILLLLPLQGICQNALVDSLENVVESLPDDSTKVNTLNHLVNILRLQDNAQALAYAEKSKELASRLEYKSGLGYALENLGWMYYRRGDYSTAFEHFTDGLTIGQQNNDGSLQARCLNDVALINVEQKLYDQGKKHLREALRLAESFHDHETAARTLGNLAMFYRSSNVDSSRYFSEKALAMATLAKSDYLKSYTWRILAELDLKEKNYLGALQKLNMSLLLARQLRNPYLETAILRRFGKLYLDQSQPDRAITYLYQSNAIAKRYRYPREQEQTYQLMVEAYKDKNNIAKAFEYQSAYLHLHDSLYDQQNTEYLALQQARFDTRLKEAQIELLTKDTRLKQEEINNQRVWIYFSLGCLLLLVLLMFVLFYSNQLKRRAHDRLAEKNREIQQQAFELASINDTKDKLFAIISHDLRGPLASLRGLVNLVEGPGLTQEEFQYASQVLKQNLDSVQENLENLLYWAQSQLKGLQVNPEVVSVKHVADSTIGLYTEAAKGKHVTITNNLDESLRVRVDSNHLRMIFRNLLSNAIKFNGQAGHITINQKIHDEFVDISVSDSGVGMTDEDVIRLFKADTHFTKPGTNQEKGVGIGLMLIKEFIERNGGTIAVSSKEGKGTSFTFTLRYDRTAVQQKEIALSSSL